MCGIAGIVAARMHGDTLRSKLEQMLGGLAHRGPDDSGIWIDGERHVGLGHRRLSIIDVENAKQPMSCMSSGCRITYNGELYNYQELRAELTGLGVSFATNSDTEVVLAAYVHWGKACLERFEGIFAFAIFDPRNDLVFLARDPFGVKPLYYALKDDSIWFASELRTLAIHSDEPLALDAKGLSQYLVSGYALAPSTVLRGFVQLPHGHSLVWQIKNSEPKVERYFDLAGAVNARAGKNISVAEATEVLSVLLRKSTRQQLISDVPVATFLSGGTDSALITKYAALYLDSPLEALTMSFSEIEFDESEAATLIADAIGVGQKFYKCSVEALHTAWRELAYKTDAPIFDSSFLPTFSLCQAASQDYKVVLSGDGGDELFLGYETYRADRLKQILDASVVGVPVVQGLFQGIVAKPGKVSLSYKLGSFGRNLSGSAPAAHGRWRELQTEVELHRWIRPDFRIDFKRHHPIQEWTSIFERVRGDLLTNLSYVDMETWLPNNILIKTDRASMSNGLEVRVPFLNKDLARFAMSLPDHVKFSMNRPKRLLQNLFKKEVPNLTKRYAKKGFGAPIASWMAGELFEEVSQQLRKETLLNQFIDMERVSDLFANIRLGNGNDASYGLWSIIVLHTWLDSLEQAKRERHAY